MNPPVAVRYLGALRTVRHGDDDVALVEMVVAQSKQMVVEQRAVQKQMQWLREGFPGAIKKETRMVSDA